MENKVIVLGSNGQLGSAIQQFKHIQPQFSFVFKCKADIDVTDLVQLDAYINSVKPYAIINCAALTNVDQLEALEDMAFLVNGIGAGNVAIVAEKYNAKLVHISTDYVFDGKGNLNNRGELRMYREYDSPNPKTIYGKSKYYGEIQVREFSRKHFIIRTSWLYGNGKNFITKVVDRALEHGKLTIVDDQIGSPTSAKEVAKMIFALLETECYGLYHGTCEGEGSWYDFACKVFKRSKIDIPIVPCSSDEFKTIARRPHYSVLDNFMARQRQIYTFKNWEEALDDYFDDKLKRGKNL